MRDGGDILALGRNIERAMAEIQAELPIGIEPTLVADQAVTVDLAINEFTTSLWQAILIIIAASFVSLGVRPGTVVALAIPLTLAIVFPIMELFDIDLQRISLGALIIALTLLVDDAMTTVDAMIRRLAAGDSKEAAATFAYRTLAAPMLTGTLVTIAGFVPIGFAASAAGEYTFSIFAVVGIALIVSWFVAVIFAPLIGMAVLKAPKDQGPAEPGRIMRAVPGLPDRRDARALADDPAHARPVRRGALRHPLRAAAVLPGLRSPRAGGRSDAAPERLDLRQRDGGRAARCGARGRSTTSSAGAPMSAAARSASTCRSTSSSPNDFFAQAVIVAKDVDARERLQAKLEQVLAEEFPDAVSRTLPARARAAGRLAGAVPRQRPRHGRGARDRARARAGHGDRSGRTAHQLRLERAGAPACASSVDQDEARRLGLSSATLAAVLNAAVTGLDRHPGARRHLPDRRRRPGDGRGADLARRRCAPCRSRCPNGRTVALGQFATFEYEQEYPLVWRRDRVPTLTVRADVAPGVLPESVVTDLAPAIAELNAGLPQGYRIELGGIAEESAQSQASVFAVVPLMLLIMLTVLMFHLQSFQRLFMVLAILPLGLIGVVAALLVSGRPLGFVAILGILALIGMIAKNARDPDHPDRGRPGARAGTSGTRSWPRAARACGRCR